MSTVTHRSIETNGIRMHIAERGAGPLVVLLHGFPESWYSWRHQLAALVDAGYRAVAPDQRKATGSYYTPRIVVHFICREVLRQYLVARLPGESFTARLRIVS